MARLRAKFELVDWTGHSRDADDNIVVDLEIAKTCPCVHCSVKRFHEALRREEPWAVQMRERAYAR